MCNCRRSMSKTQLTYVTRSFLCSTWCNINVTNVEDGVTQKTQILVQGRIISLYKWDAKILFIIKILSLSKSYHILKWYNLYDMTQHHLCNICVHVPAAIVSIHTVNLVTFVTSRQNIKRTIWRMVSFILYIRISSHSKETESASIIKDKRQIG